MVLRIALCPVSVCVDLIDSRSSTLFTPEFTILIFIYYKSPGAVVKASCLESRRLRVRTPLWQSGSKETGVSSPLTRERFSIVRTFRDREVASQSASDRQGSNFGFIS